jgi:hypothetical protein
MHSEKIIKMLPTKKITTLTLKNLLLNITHNKGVNSEISITDIEKIYLSPKKTSLNNWIYYIIILVIIGTLAVISNNLLEVAFLDMILLFIVFKILSDDKKHILVIEFRKRNSYFMPISTKDKTEITDTIKLIWEIKEINSINKVSQYI